MKKSIFKLIPLLIFLYPNLYRLSAQKKADNNYYIWHDNIVGERNLDIYKGKVFIPKFVSKEKERQFFQQGNHSKTHIVYDGQSYYNLAIRYDLLNDQVLLYCKTGLWNGWIVLASDKIERLSMDAVPFTHLNDFENSQIKSGFYKEVSTDGKIKLYEKLSKAVRKRIIDRKTYYEFKDSKSLFLIKNNEDYTLIENIRDLIFLFPTFKKQILDNYNKKVHKANESNSFKNSVEQLNQLIK
ncbi:hypothetical protein [Maribacter sp. 2210JD10-5]|uniref:hypothetical protein n=1 Tax=Maribacter sp. 2210JD10-5 TaxID=3386272 RepID=UPI0039BD103C